VEDFSGRCDGKKIFKCKCITKRGKRGGGEKEVEKRANQVGDG